MGNRGFAGKWSHYEDALRVPLIICDPRVPTKQRGQVTDASALNLDFPATFWIAGVKIPERYQGRSLKPVVEGGKPAGWRSETFHEHHAVRGRIPAFEGLRNQHFKYVRYTDFGNHEFLHDLKNDRMNLKISPKTPSTTKCSRPCACAPMLASRAWWTVEPVGEFWEIDGPSSNRFGGCHRAALSGWVCEPDRRRSARLGWRHETLVCEKGVLTGTTDGTLKANSFLTWKGSTIRNFDRVQVRVTLGGNSGI